MKIAAFPVAVNPQSMALASDRNAGDAVARDIKRQLNPNNIPVAANDREGPVLQGEVLYSRSTPRSSASSSKEGYTSTQRERPGYQPRSPVNDYSRRIAVEAYKQNEELAQDGLVNVTGSIDVYA